MEHAGGVAAYLQQVGGTCARVASCCSQQTVAAMPGLLPAGDDQYVPTANTWQFTAAQLVVTAHHC